MILVPQHVVSRDAVDAYHRQVQDPQRDLVDPAVKGTKNVLQAAVKSKDTVKRVVVTSSFAGSHIMFCSAFTWVSDKMLVQRH